MRIARRGRRTALLLAIYRVVVPEGEQAQALDLPLLGPRFVLRDEGVAFTEYRGRSVNGIRHLDPVVSKNVRCEFEDLATDVHKNDTAISKEGLVLIDQGLIAVSKWHDETFGANELGPENGALWRTRDLLDPEKGCVSFRSRGLKERTMTLVSR